MTKAPAARCSASVAVPASARPRTRPRSAPTTRSWPRRLLPIRRPRSAPPPPRNVDGLPLGQAALWHVTAINLDTGDIVWQVPHGDTPDEIKNNPALKGLNIPKTGTGRQCRRSDDQDSGGPWAMAPMSTAAGSSARRLSARAMTRRPAQQVGAVYMPAPQSGSPMTYSYDGKQYIMVAVSRRQLLGRLSRLRLAPGWRRSGAGCRWTGRARRTGRPGRSLSQADKKKGGSSQDGPLFLFLSCAPPTGRFPSDGLKSMAVPPSHFSACRAKINWADQSSWGRYGA